MICPHCKNMNSPKEVLNTWMVRNGSVKRKRRCSRCKGEFHTVEMVLVMKGRIMHALHNLSSKRGVARAAILIYGLYFATGDITSPWMY